MWIKLHSGAYTLFQILGLWNLYNCISKVNTSTGGWENVTAGKAYIYVEKLNRCRECVPLSCFLGSLMLIGSLQAHLTKEWTALPINVFVQRQTTIPLHTHLHVLPESHDNKQQHITIHPSYGNSNKTESTRLNGGLIPSDWCQYICNPLKWFDLWFAQYSFYHILTWQQRQGCLLTMLLRTLHGWWHR